MGGREKGRGTKMFFKRGMGKGCGEQFVRSYYFKTSLLKGERTLGCVCEVGAEKAVHNGLKKEEYGCCWSLDGDL